MVNISTFSDMIDQWLSRLDFQIEQYAAEIAIRHEYDPIKGVWNKVEIKIKMETKPFGNGSMRECFRLYVTRIDNGEDNLIICLMIV